MEKIAKDVFLYICQDMPAHIGGRYCKSAETIRRLFKPALNLNEAGICEQCAKHY